MDVVEKAFTGKPCPEKEWQNKIFPLNISYVIKRYGIKFDKETLIPSDNSLADDVFRAALDFLVEAGFYCADTERIVKFDENEIKEAIKNMPSQVIVGEGKDVRMLNIRKPEDTVPPFCCVGGGGTPVSSDEVFLNVVSLYASIPRSDGISAPCLTSLDGLRARPNSPIELALAARAGVLAREAMRKAGKPGMPIMNSVATAESATAHAVSLLRKDGMRLTDAYDVCITDPLTVDFNRLNKLYMMLSLGAPHGVCYGPMFGGYCGGPEGTAVANVASYFVGALCQSTHLLQFPIHLLYACSSSPELLWVISVTGQAISRNTHICSMNANYAAAGPCTEMSFYETLTAVISGIISGYSGIMTSNIACAAREDYIATPLEPKLAVEVSNAMLGMKREYANEIVKKLTVKYIDKLAKPPTGKSFQEWFDRRTGKVIGECFEIYDKVRKELENLGIEFKD